MLGVDWKLAFGGMNVWQMTSDLHDGLNLPCQLEGTRRLGEVCQLG